MSAPQVTRIARTYGKALCHLNHARRTHRLGLILGSGVSDDLGIPKWNKLITRIDTELTYDSEGAPESYRAEQLFQHYKATKEAELRWPDSDKLNAAVTSGWRELVARSLYRQFLSSTDSHLDENAYKKKVEQHPYLSALGRLARHAELVVTHNFDDALECAIDLDPAVTEVAPGRRYYSFWRPEPFLRMGMVNIYHPNGFTPLRRDARGSESLILTEASFADHLANTNTEESHFLLRHLADKTHLIIGHSLSDGTLKNALRQHANQRPAHVNYYVHWLPPGEVVLEDSHRHAIREANFETYGLITIFANSAQISHILRVILMEEEEIHGYFAHLSMPTQFVYYLVGAVSSGKSTIMRHLRNLETIEEWPSRMPPVMNRPSVGLKKDEGAAIDDGLEEAIWVKNSEIHKTKAGIVAVDRAPLDFIAFPVKKTEKLADTARKRTSLVLKRLEATGFRELCSGQVIVVHADVEVLLERQLQRSGRTTPEEVTNGSHKRYLKRQQDRLAQIYKPAIDQESCVETNRYSVVGAAKAVARIIHLDNYKPFSFTAQLKKIKEAT
jgi:dephospho-CoA kinase